MVKLNPYEQKLAKDVAKKRFEACRKRHAEPTVYGDEAEEKREINAFGAELAFAKLANVYPDLDPSKTRKQDVTLNDGRTVDVKTTTRHDGKLLLKVKAHQNRCDLYVLMIGDMPVYRFAGWIEGEFLVQDYRIDRTLQYPAYVAERHELHTEEAIR